MVPLAVEGHLPLLIHAGTRLAKGLVKGLVKGLFTGLVKGLARGWVMAPDFTCVGAGRAAGDIAFSSEVVAGPREENASKQKR